MYVLANAIRRKRTMISIAASFCLLILCSAEVVASEFSGTIKRLAFDKAASGARVSIEVGPHDTPCGGGAPANYYAFENAHTGLGALWTAAVVTALAQNLDVIIYGNGRCDNFDVEGIGAIDVFPK